MHLYCCPALHYSTTQPTAGTEVVTTGIMPFYVIGNEGGFFPSVVGPITNTGVLMGPAERYDIILDFSAVPAGE
jgi:spore coat protein A